MSLPNPSRQPSTSTPPPARDGEWLAEWPLKDGAVVRIRDVRPDDEPLITEAIRTASRETLLHRFFSPIRSVSPDLLRRMLTIDRSQERCLVGVVEQNGDTRIIGGARYVKLPRPGAAEFALTVHDDFQSRGLGTFLMRLLVNLARAEGLHRLEADVMSSNNKMLRLCRKSEWGRAHWQRLGDVYHVVIELEPPPARRARPA